MMKSQRAARIAWMGPLSLSKGTNDTLVARLWRSDGLAAGVRRVDRDNPSVGPDDLKRVMNATSSD
jgi:hypothetical protein